jgi:hypothetical protein
VLRSHAEVLQGYADIPEPGLWFVPQGYWRGTGTA